jgi:hypothetical protein
MTSLLTHYCNPYGAETGGAEKLLGGLQDASKVFHQWHCDNPARARYRMLCEHGHQGQPMWLCDAHARAFKLRDMTFCPPCNRTPPGHKCYLILTEVS